MNQANLEVVKHETVRINVNILGTEMDGMAMGKFNSDDHYIYYCGPESYRRNGVALIKKRKEKRKRESEMQYLGVISKMTE